MILSLWIGNGCPPRRCGRIGSWPSLVAISLVACVYLGGCASNAVPMEQAVADVPELPAFVKPLDGRTLQPDSVLATAWLGFCVHALTGFEIDFDESPIGVLTTDMSQPGYDAGKHSEANVVCEAEGEKRDYVVTLTDELRADYPALVAQHECLTDLGLAFDDPSVPSLEEVGAQGWDPFSDLSLDPALLSPDERIRAYQQCGEDRSLALQGMEDQ